MCYGFGFRVLDADGLGPLPKSHGWNAYPAPAVSLDTQAYRLCFKLFMYGWLHCVVGACGSLFFSISMIWIQVFKEVFVSYGPGFRVLDAQLITCLECVFSSGCLLDIQA